MEGVDGHNDITGNTGNIITSNTVLGDNMEDIMQREFQDKIHDGIRRLKTGQGEKGSLS